jgi:hypothetical protein
MAPKRKARDISEKYQMIQDRISGKKPSEILELYDIKSSSFATIWKDRESTIAEFESSSAVLFSSIKIKKNNHFNAKSPILCPPSFYMVNSVLRDLI